MNTPAAADSSFANSEPVGVTAQATLVFVDLCGSTSLYENLGNERGTRAVTRIVDWMCHSCRTHGGQVIKTLGDGALMRFDSVLDALTLSIELQRRHEERIRHWPAPLHAKIQIGVATGEVLDVLGDCFGDAVNVASRLAGMSGAGQIWADRSTLEALPPRHPISSRSLGSVPVRGKAEPLDLFQIEWVEHAQSSMMTIPGGLPDYSPSPLSTALDSIKLSWLDDKAHFSADEGAFLIGRDESVGFVIRDNRVSRRHARIEWQTTPSGGHFVLTDLSSFGTWVRFTASHQQVELRRQRCTLSGDGEIALGASFSDYSVPIVSFALLSAHAAAAGARRLR